jgi:uncharacterized protein
MDCTDPPPPSVARGLRRPLYLLLGAGFVGLAVLGAFLPVLPTTPFLLLASFFFLRSYPTLNDRLLRSRLFGPFLRDWQQHRAVRPRVKVVAIVCILAAVGVSALSGRLPTAGVAALVVLGAVGLVVVLRLPVIREPAMVPVPVEDIPATERLPAPDDGRTMPV